MDKAPSNDPLHGVTLEHMLTALVAGHGWDGLGRQIDIRCFTHDPSLQSSLKFLRRTPWARERVELLYAQIQQGDLLAKPNYQFEKRQRDLAKKSKQEEKRRQKLAAKAAEGGGDESSMQDDEATDGVEGDTADAASDDAAKTGA